MGYKSYRYKEGLSGKKPSWIRLDEAGHRAQEVGYRHHLANVDLVERLKEARRERNSGSSYSSYSSEPTRPLTRGQRRFWSLVSFIGGIVLSFGMMDAYQRHPAVSTEDFEVFIVFGIINLIPYYFALRLLLPARK